MIRDFLNYLPPELILLSSIVDTASFPTSQRGTDLLIQTKTLSNNLRVGRNANLHFKDMVVPLKAMRMEKPLDFKHYREEIHGKWRVGMTHLLIYTNISGGKYVWISS